ncbi:MAG: ABC transporter ATP-binding protein [Rhodospirillales bacterium]|nr:ABC transporter ATP-binding protein [Rhodospirillales bacterium]
MTAIEITDLHKTYAASGKSGRKDALKGVSLSIPRGSMFALLGPNGAGKSTLINILAGLVMKTSGQVRIWDTDIDADPRQARANIGIVPQEIVMDPFLTPAKALDIQAGLYGVPKPERRTKELLEIVGLADKANAPARSLSGGMKRRLMVAKAMVHTPPILVLDEPTAGVDVELRRQLWSNVKELNRQGVTILLTTHYLEEAQELCDKIAIINHGNVVVCEETSTLLGRLNNKEITFRLDQDISEIPPALSAFNTTLPTPRTLKIRYSPEEQSVGDMIAALQRAKLGIIDISTDESDLEDVFLQLTQ